MRNLGPEAGVAQLDFISDRTREQLQRGVMVSCPAHLEGRAAHSLCIQIEDRDPSVVLIDTLSPGHRWILTTGSWFEMKAGKTVLANGTITIGPGERKAA